jgi:hypothetical protein
MVAVSSRSVMLTTSMRLLRVLMVALTAGCVHPHLASPSLIEALRLETDLKPTDLRDGNRVRARFFVRNIASSPVEFCQVDNGVTVVAINERGSFPLVGHGITLDAGPRCYKLASDETTEYDEELFWTQTIARQSQDFKQLQGSIRVRSRNGVSSLTLTTEPVLVSAR